MTKPKSSSAKEALPLVCVPKRLPLAQLDAAAEIAVRENPVNHAPVHRLLRVMPKFVVQPQHIAVLTTKYWGSKGKTFSVSFLDTSSASLRSRILSHMNAWSSHANVKFQETNGVGEVRIARQGGDDGGYWSYLGTDILSIPQNSPTMNLEAFTMITPDSEFHRVVRHETGHTLGFPHEHMRKELVDRIDVQKAIAHFGETQGWSPEEVRRQVLTPLEESSLLGTPHPDPFSIMCYEIPGSITKDGQPIFGGSDIDEQDFDFAGKIYPKPQATPATTPNVVADVPSSYSTTGCEDAIVIDFASGEVNRVRIKRTASGASNTYPISAAGQGGGGGPSHQDIKAEVDAELCKASGRKPKPTPPLSNSINLSGDLNIGPNTKKQLANNYNGIIQRHGGGPFVSPSEAGALETVGDAVNLVLSRV